MSRPSGVRRLLLAPLVVALVALPWSDRVSAHTDLDFTLPTDGASVGEPVDEVTVAFTSPVTLVGDAFEALDPQGNVLRPAAATTDDTVFILQFDPPLTGGDVGVRYEVRAEDGHVVSGSFSFSVDAPASTTVTTAVPATVPPTTASPPVTAGASPTTVAVAPPATLATAPSTSAPEPSTDAVDVAAGAGEVVDPDSVAASTDDGGSGIGVIIALAAVVAVGAAGFLLVRSRTGSA